HVTGVQTCALPILCNTACAKLPDPAKKSNTIESFLEPKSKSNLRSSTGLGFSNIVGFPNISDISLDPEVFMGAKSQSVVQVIPSFTSHKKRLSFGNESPFLPKYNSSFLMSSSTLSLLNLQLPLLVG